MNGLVCAGAVGNEEAGAGDQEVQRRLPPLPSVGERRRERAVDDRAKQCLMSRERVSRGLGDDVPTPVSAVGLPTVALAGIDGVAERKARVCRQRIALERPGGQPMDDEHESAARLDGIQSSLAVVSAHRPGRRARQMKSFGNGGCDGKHSLRAVERNRRLDDLCARTEADTDNTKTREASARIQHAALRAGL